jgi:hypothetical protein
LKEAGRYEERGNIAMPVVVLPVMGGEFKKNGILPERDHHVILTGIQHFNRK